MLTARFLGVRQAGVSLILTAVSAYFAMRGR